ncbi:hypothetical protein BCR42DRAFT_456403 [Absidia repens]|uniref:Heterokaryon incompatibility domain-containing protein n=1 Tax=Absidia repens TaxID=90262 RepID=A0A1X2HZY2_9FUNG|nr:hypothetical protein BCR42DRAFT_456403 [Absidia repens]
MTKDNSPQTPFQELTCDNTQRQEQEKPFKVVLIDIRTAGNSETIECIEMPLETEGLKFVALSYRWGELAETIIDTNLGYLATVTSFAMNDFYCLCRKMIDETDLKSIRYAWVDAICVDQTNYKRRKATIHHMSDIYERATYIVAIPDLHRQYLLNVSSANEKFAQDLDNNDNYIYHLIQGHTDELVELDKAFFDHIKTTKEDLDVETWRTTYAKYVWRDSTGMDGFRFIPDNCYGKFGYRPTKQVFLKNYPYLDGDPNMKNQPRTDLNDHISIADFPLLDPRRGYRDLTDMSSMTWKNLIIRRRNEILHAIQSLIDLIKDWSSRVWVISEFHIAKKKNNLKFWFIGLSGVRLGFSTFFEFDFGDTIVPPNTDLKINAQRHYRALQNTMIKQLTTQTFFQMMLGAKASKNEDRFYAILPHSKYKNKIDQVAHWNISTLLSVKLKLFEIVDVRDKLLLLFLAGNSHGPNSYESWPSFATSTITFASEHTDFHSWFPSNFELNNNNNNGSSPILLQHGPHSQRYFLQLTPKTYYVRRRAYNYGPKINTWGRQIGALRERLLPYNLGVFWDTVCIPYFNEKERMQLDDKKVPITYGTVHLIGSFDSNTWTLINVFDERTDWQLDDVYNHNLYHYRDNNHKGIVFNIY